jgi:hypothetical protein
MALGAVLLLAPPSAGAEGDSTATDARIKAMEQRLLVLEDKVAEKDEVIERQRSMLEQGAPAAVGQGSEEGGGLDAFLRGLEVGGFVTSSYVYNFNNPSHNGGGANSDGLTLASAPQVLCQFNCGHNEFTLDAAMFSIGKAAEEPGQAGFQLDLLFGQNASILRSLSTDVNRGPGPTTVNAGGGPGGSHDFFSGTSDFDLFVQEGYVSYNYRGALLKFGKFETLMGAEVLDSHKNANISHGLLFTWAIPLFHTGLLASGGFGDDDVRFGWAAGVTNGFNNSTDSSDNKGLIGQLSMETGPFFGSISTFHGTLEEQIPLTSGTPVGAMVGDNDPLTQIYDLVLQLKPSDQLRLWLNADYGLTDRNDVGTGSARFWGASTGVAFDITEKLFMALRGEYFNDENDSRFGFGPTLFGPGRVKDTTAVSATATVGYRLTDHLMARLELRHDDADTDARGGLDPRPFPEDRNLLGGESQATYGIFEVSYVFD